MTRCVPSCNGTTARALAEYLHLNQTTLRLYADAGVEENITAENPSGYSKVHQDILTPFFSAHNRPVFHGKVRLAPVGFELDGGFAGLAAFGGDEHHTVDCA